MNRRFRIDTQLCNYKATFHMVLSDEDRSNKTLRHMKELIFKHDHVEVLPKNLNHFYESYREIEILGNSQADLIPPDFRLWVMGDALCLRFIREDQRIDTTDFVDRQTLLQNPDEWSEQISWWQEDEEVELLTLAGVPLKPKSFRSKKKKVKEKVAAASK